MDIDYNKILEKTQIEKIRAKSINNSLMLISLFLIFPVSILFIRDFGIRITLNDFFQLGIFLILVLTSLFKSKLSTNLKSWIFSGAITFSGLVSFSQHGLYGLSIAMIVGGCMFSSFYLGKKSAIIMIALSFLYMTIIGVLQYFSFIEISEKILLIADSPYSWIISMYMSAMMITLFIYNNNLITQKFNKSIDDLNKRTEELLKTNEKLGEEVLERTKSEIALKISEEKYKAMFNEANDTILILENGIVQRFNNKAIEMFGYSRDEMVGKSIFQLSPEKQINGNDSKISSDEILKKASYNESLQFEWIHKTKDDITFDTEISLTQIKIGDKKIIQAIIRDISLRKEYERELENHKNNLELLVAERTQEIEKINEELQATVDSLNYTNNLLEKENKIREMAEEELLKYQAELRESNTAKDKFFSIIAHDLKNPFHLIINFSELLSGKMGHYDEEKKQKFIDYIGSTAKQGYELLKNLLAWARSQTDTIKYQPKAIHLDKIVSETIMLHQTSAEQKKIVVVNQIIPNSLVYGDIDMLKTIVRNLISNAIKFTRPDGSIVISNKLEDKIYTIEVKDNGVGIDENTIDKLFVTRTNRSTSGTQGEEGTGLGLVLCKEFVEKNSGKIWVESKIGEGTSFFFTIPQYIAKKVLTPDVF